MNIDLADTKYNKPKHSQIEKKKDPLKVFLILVFLGVLGWLGFLFFQKHTLIKENLQFENSIETITKKLKESSNSDNPAKKVAMAKVLKKAKAERILWSKVMAKVIGLKRPGIDFSDFSVTPKGEVQAVLSAKSFNSIQQFISSLNNNKEIEKVLIKSIRQEESLTSNALVVDLDFNISI